MKTICAGLFLLLLSGNLFAQETDSAKAANRVPNMYGDLLNDDPKFNKKYSPLIPAVEVIGANVFFWSIDRYVFDFDFSHVNPDTWQRNLEGKWVWDDDRFGVNFVGHPYSGTAYFNAARSNGYNYVQSFPFAVGGSLMWEYFCENTAPSYNDIINTPVNGAFLGEVLYRISSNILDDRAVGGERVLREIAATIINPMRGFNRLWQGKMTRATTQEVYQKEPMNITLYGGIHKRNELINMTNTAHTAASKGKNENAFFTGHTNQMFNLQIDYGNPFEERARKPFDLFRFRTELSFATGRKVLDNITGYGILAGKNLSGSTLLGAFQYYDYWDNLTFELATIGFGGGFFAKLPIGEKSDFYGAVHIGGVPLAGTTIHNNPDTTSEVRDYSYGGGAEGRFEATLNILNRISARFIAFYYAVQTYQGPPGRNYITILQPNISVRLFGQVHLGFEQIMYSSDRRLFDFPVLRQTSTEQKIFLLVLLEDKQRSGRYH